METNACTNWLASDYKTLARQVNVTQLLQVLASCTANVQLRSQHVVVTRIHIDGNKNTPPFHHVFAFPPAFVLQWAH
jgi:hypothetical protein